MNITAELFEVRVGRKPRYDDLERCNCKKAGTFGHHRCGWNIEFNLPQFMVGPSNMPVSDDTRFHLNSRNKK